VRPRGGAGLAWERGSWAPRSDLGPSDLRLGDARGCCERGKPGGWRKACRKHSKDLGNGSRNPLLKSSFSRQRRETLQTRAGWVGGLVLGGGRTGLGLETQGLTLGRQAFWCLSHSASPVLSWVFLRKGPEKHGDRQRGPSPSAQVCSGEET
jgi:hypothetical protein